MKFIKHNIKKIIIFSIIILIAGIFIYKNLQSKPSSEQSATVTRGTLEEALTISGKIQARDHIKAQFLTTGKLIGVGVKEGDYIKKNQWLASLDQQETQKKIEKYLNSYIKTRDTFDQTADDNKDKILTDKIKRILNDSQQDLENSVLDVEIQTLAKEYSHLYAPIEGIVTHIDTPYPNVYISIPSQSSFEIINPKTVYFSATPDQNEVVKINKDMTADITLDAYPDTPFKGTVSQVAFSPKEGETDTVYEVKMDLPIDNSSYQYKIGMTGDATFTTNRKENVLYLPIKFVTSENGKKYINVKENDKKIKKEVTTGLESENFIEITSNISEGTVVYD